MRLILSLLLVIFSINLQAQTVLTLGVVPQFPVKKLHSIWMPIVRTLEEETGYRFILKGSPDIPTFEKEFMAGQFDIAYMNPYHFLVAQNIYTPVVRDIGRQLYGIIVVAANSPIQSVSDLDGQAIALPAPNALGASLMTRAAMTHDYQIDYTEEYVKTHSSVYINVALGKTAAGGGVQKTLNQQPENIKKRLRVLYQTEKVSPHPLVAKKSLPPEVLRTLQQALLKIAQTEKGQQLLSKVPFKKLGIATTEDYKALEALNLAPFFQKSN